MSETRSHRATPGLGGAPTLARAPSPADGLRRLSASSGKWVMVSDTSVASKNGTIVASTRENFSLRDPSIWGNTTTYDMASTGVLRRRQIDPFAFHDARVA